MLTLKTFFHPQPLTYHTIYFVAFWVMLEIIMYGVNHEHRHFVLGIEVKQTDCTFRFNRYFFSGKNLYSERKNR